MPINFHSCIPRSFGTIGPSCKWHPPQLGPTKRRNPQKQTDCTWRKQAHNSDTQHKQSTPDGCFTFFANLIQLFCLSFADLLFVCLFGPGLALSLVGAGACGVCACACVFHGFSCAGLAIRAEPTDRVGPARELQEPLRRFLRLSWRGLGVGWALALSIGLRQVHPARTCLPCGLLVSSLAEGGLLGRSVAQMPGETGSFFWEGNPLSYGGCTEFCTALKPWKTIVCLFVFTERFSFEGFLGAGFRPSVA